MGLELARFFGFPGLVHQVAGYSQPPEENNWVHVSPLTGEGSPSQGKAATPTSFLSRVQQELPIRISCFVGAYFAIPVFALLGGACQAGLLVYTAWTGIILPVLRNTQSNNSSENRFVQPLEQCSEHLLRLSLNICMYFFRRSTALAFSSPSFILFIHSKIEGLPLSQREENPNAYIHVFARLLTGMILNKPLSESDTADAKKVFTPVSHVWNLFSQITREPRLGERITAFARLFFGAQPEQNTPPFPGSDGNNPAGPATT